MEESCLDDSGSVRELASVDWIPVPGEGWGIEAFSAENPDVLCLNGTWRFALRDRDPQEGWFRIRDGTHWRWNPETKALEQAGAPPRDHPLDRQLVDAAANTDDWSPIRVPGNWESQAFSQHVFAHCSLDKDDKVGYYRREFRVPADWAQKGGRVILQAEGIAASAEVTVNGERIGYHDGGFVPFQMDVTHAVRFDAENVLAVRVVKGDVSTVHDNSGQWMMSGIWRDIFLFRVPEFHVEDLRVEPDFDPETGEGRLTATIRGCEGAAECDVQAALYPWDGDEPVEASCDISRTERDGRPVWKVALASGEVQPWTPETPVMVRLECRLMRDGHVVEVVREEVGFRRFSAVGEQFLLNGRPFLIRGVTRHEIKQGAGRSLTLGDMLEEIRLMREANINGVRSHPYPFDPRWIRLCARHGILVCSGYCLCGFNSWGNPWAMSEAPTYPKHESEIDAGYRELFRDRYHFFAPRIFARLKNMTAVFAWSLSNESAISEIFVPVAHFLRDREKGRFILSAGDVCMNTSGFDKKHPEQADVIEHVRWDCMTADSQHYPERYSLEELPKTVPWSKERPRPMFYTEAAHPFSNRDNFVLDPAMHGDLYGSGLKRVFEVVRTMPGVGGFFIFEWCDQSVMQKGDPALSDSFIRPWHGYTTHTQNIKGILGGNHEPKPSYHSVRKSYAQVRIEPVAVDEARVLARIHNDYTFRSLDTLRFTATPREGATPVGVSRTVAVSATPGESADVSIPLEVAGEASVLRIAVFDPGWPGPVAERDIRIRPENPVRQKPARGEAEPDRKSAFEMLRSIAQRVQLSFGVAESLGQQRYVGMGHLPLGDIPKEFVTGRDIRERHREQTNAAGGTEKRVETCRLSDNRGGLRSTVEIGVDERTATLRICQMVEREGDPVWVSGIGLSFLLSSAYQHIEWLRHRGVWTEYPENHPDRLVGREVLDLNEYPPVNPFRHPSFSSLLPVRNAATVALRGDWVPEMVVEAPREGQRVTVRSAADHRREVLLLAEAQCSHPYHEFSFHRSDAARQSLLGLRPLREGEPVELTWNLSLRPAKNNASRENSTPMHRL